MNILMRIKSKRAVPVANRSEPEKRRLRLQAPFSLSGLRALVLLGVLVFVSFMIYTPLNTYLQQKAEMKRVEASIASKEQEKEQLIEEIDRYQDEAYIREQAKLRLGLVEQGETAFRLVDPALEDATSANANDDAELDREKPWYKVLWKSLATAPVEEAPEEDPEMHLPIAPAPEEATP
ncbi:Cell division protein FtsL [Corynebacterium pseudopelargi]|uniref:Cell division protein FtsL n=2 Tax=Corynebacterium pseudopelargi TaxID=2080757 RepID=A0A3G6IVF7_9CORY|nr:Cell division protein FtsL [Corynebacterium pseudopelargi]